MNQSLYSNKIRLRRLRPDWPSLLQPGVTSSAGAAEETSSKGNEHFVQHSHCGAVSPEVAERGQQILWMPAQSLLRNCWRSLAATGMCERLCV